MPGPSVLTALDRLDIQCYHFKAVMIAGSGFFADAYDLFAVVSVTKLLGRLYYFHEGDTKPGKLPPGVYEAVLGTAYCGAVCGQLFFGWAGDKLGRRKVYGITLILMIVSSIMSALSFGRTAKGVITTLCFFRFWLGVGLGGDYPLSATIMSEYSNTSYRGAFVAMVFAMQGLGIVTAAGVTVILSIIFKTVYNRPPFYQNPERSTAPEADYLWRTIFMLGALWAVITYYFRMRMPETARYTELVLNNGGQAAADMQRVLRAIRSYHNSRTPPIQPSFGLFSREFARRHGKELLGVCVCWLSIDVAFYSLSIYQKDIFTAVNWLPRDPRQMSALEETYKISRAQALIALVATIPGYWVTVATVDTLGRKPIQLLGFGMMAIFMILLAADFPSLSRQGDSFVAVYALTLFFANFGPNSTTFIISAELFPTRLRTTCNGIAAAAGKLGAIVGVFGVVRKEGAGVGRHSRVVLGLIAIFCVIGFGFTFLLPETKRIPLEILSQERTRAEVEDEERNGEDYSEERSATFLLNGFSNPLSGESELLQRTGSGQSYHPFRRCQSLPR